MNEYGWILLGASWTLTFGFSIYFLILAVCHPENHD